MHLSNPPALTMTESLTLHAEQSPNKCLQNKLSPISNKKLPSILDGTSETLCPCTIEKLCGGVSLNICKKVQNIEFGKKDCKTE